MEGLRRRIAEVAGGRRVAVVGVGNRMRGDDGAGSEVAGRLLRLGAESVFDADEVPENFLGPLLALAPAVVLFVDAADHGGRPGECCLAGVGALAARGSSTHAMSLRLMASALEANGIECRLVGIQPAGTAFGAARSPAVDRAVRAVALAIAAALQSAEAVHA